jgi:hypothetical protein
MRKISAKILVFLFLTISFLTPLTISAPAQAAPGDLCQTDGSFLGLPTWYKYLEAREDPSGRCSPVLSGADTESKVNSALPIGLAILEAMIRLAGIVAVVMIFVAGFRYITSQGNPDAAAAARKTAFNSLIGLVIVVTATGLVSFIGSRLAGS